MKRMTDERLAEIERAVYDVEGWPVNCSEELLQALKAERAEVKEANEAALNHAIAAFTAERAQDAAEQSREEMYEAAQERTARCLELQAKLRAVGELPKYRVVLTPHLGLPALEECDTGNIVKRDELEALLNKAPKP